MTTALVGSTGFVGGNLRLTEHFDVLVNSKNGDELAGRHFDRVVFAAAKAEKWRINQDPEADEAHIADLERLLSSFTTDRLVLISTVDVYGDPAGVDESTPVEVEGLHAYGANRYRLEESAAAIHPTLVVRLPGLFGEGLKKNVIFDLLNGNNVDRIHHAGSFQYYNLARLGRDIERALDADLTLINFMTEPVRTDEVARAAFGIDFDSEPDGVKPASYDVWTGHAAVFGGTGHYLADREAVLAELTEFVARQRAGSPA